MENANQKLQPEANPSSKKHPDERRYAKWIFITEMITWILIALFSYLISNGSN